MPELKSILIVDDHPLFREGLKAIIASDKRFKVIGEAGSGTEGLRKAIRLKPDIVLVDISLPELNGFELTKEICNALPKTFVMVISMHSKFDYVIKSFKSGARGYLVKEAASGRLLDGIQTVSTGGYFLDSPISQQLIEKIINMDENQAKINDSKYEQLTPREQQVMRLITEGFTSKEIADKLFISTKTVENHRGNIMQKLDLHSSIELMRYAYKIGLVDTEII